jgi:hypothetical protein
MVRKLLLGCVAALAGAAVVGCSGPSKPVSAPAPVTSSGSVSSATAPASGPAASATPRCPAAQIAISAGPVSRTADHTEVIVLMRNNGSSACRLEGFPGVAGIDQNGNRGGDAVQSPSGSTQGAATLPLVDLTPGATASALVVSSDVPQGGIPCPKYQGLLVSSPGGDQWTKLDTPVMGCQGLQVHPTFLGTSGRQSA